MNAIQSFISLHGAENMNWHRYITGTFEAQCGGHTVHLTELHNGNVLFFWAGPLLHHRKFREFKPGEHRVQTEEHLRKLAAL